MSDLSLLTPDTPELALQTEVIRLHKIIHALMDRSERSASYQGNDFSLFQTAIELEDQVSRRTAELEAALRKNEEINRALRDSEARFRGMVSQSLVGIFIFEQDHVSYTNAKFNAIFACSAEVVGQRQLHDFVVAADQAQVQENIRRILSGECEQIESVVRGLRCNGDEIFVEFHASAMNLDGQRSLICLVLDVTERTQAEHTMRDLQQQLFELSTHDVLTGLYNRRYLEESLGQELLAAERHGHPISIIMADLDHFKKINDRYGHLAGDAVLRTFGALLKKNARGSDVYCRYGGEEFLLVLPLMACSSALERAEHLGRVLEASAVPYGASLIAVTASFGVATFPQDGHSGDSLIAAADRALYQAKAAGRNCVRPATPQNALPATGQTVAQPPL